MTRRLSRLRATDAGLGLVEVLVTMLLMGVVSTLVVGAVVQSTRILTHTQDEDHGLQDAKVILDRLGRDVRESRGVVCDGGLADPTDSTSADPTCSAHLQLWVDANSDYAQQPTEIITWRLERSADDEHFDVYRITGSGAAAQRQRQASTLIVRLAFAYDAAAFDDVQRVDMRMRYDAIIGRGAGDREVVFSTRLRNKGDR